MDTRVIIGSWPLAALVVVYTARQALEEKARRRRFQYGVLVDKAYSLEVIKRQPFF